MNRTNTTRDKIKKIVIITGYSCNNNCLFCINSKKRALRNKNTYEIKIEMIKARKSGAIYLELIGGETTIRLDIISLLRFAKKLGFQYITMATNGRMFAHKEFAKKIINSGITSIIFSIHGHERGLHDYLTNTKGSFDQLISGIKNLKELGFYDIYSNTTIVNKNIKKLSSIGRLLLNLGVKNSEFIFADPTYGGVYDNFSSMMPKISLAAPYIKKVLRLGKKMKIDWTIRYVPVCYFTGYYSQISELREIRRFNTQHFAPDFINLNVEDSRKNVSRTKTEKCLKCKEYDNCEGIWKEYLRRFGDAELNPIK